MKRPIAPACKLLIVLLPACRSAPPYSPAESGDAAGDEVGAGDAAAAPEGGGDARAAAPDAGGDASDAARDAPGETPATSCGAGYTLDNQQPTTCVPYAANPRCLTCKELPGAGLGGPQDHLFAGSDATASAMVTNANGGIYRFYGDGHAAQAPFYYASASDPWYRIVPGTCYYERNLDVAFHAPEGASYSLAGGGDSNLAVWDQAQGLIVEMYNHTSTTLVFPPAKGCGGSASTACALPQSFGGGCGVERPFGGAGGTDQDWGRASESFGTGETIGGSSNEFAAWAGTARLDELQLGRIVHALIGDYGCSNPNAGNDGVVFPAHDHLWISTNCTPGAAAGQLFFTDYTDAQVATMNVPQWQKIVLTALSHYGTYVLDTGGAATNYVAPLSYNYGVEGFQAWRFAHPSCNSPCASPSSACDMCNNPGFFGWLDTQSGVVGGEDIYPWKAVPLVDGEGIEGHIHIADPCVAAGMAGAHPGESGAPAACVGSLWVDLAGPASDGTGAGTVTSSCSGADCAPISCVGGYCNLTSNNGRQVSLTPTASPGHTFTGWSGACTGTGACKVTLDGTQGVVQVVARFD